MNKLKLIGILILIANGYLRAQNSDLQNLFYSNKNERIDNLYFMSNEIAIGIRDYTKLVLLNKGLIVDEFDVKSITRGNYESVQAFIVLDSNQVMVRTIQACFSLSLLNNKILYDSLINYRKINIGSVLNKVFSKDGENANFNPNIHHLMGIYGGWIVGYTYKEKKNNTPLFWVANENEYIEINSNDQMVTNDSFNPNWHLWLKPGKFANDFILDNNKIIFISPLSNKAFIFDTETKQRYSFSFPDLNKSKSWYLYCDRLTKEYYLVNKVGKKNQYRVFSLDENLSSARYISSIHFFPKGFIDGKIHQQINLGTNKHPYSDHYLVPLDTADTEYRIILEPVIIYDGKNKNK